jgi:TolB-like protein/Tfp pilus assembly protein PilF
VNGLRDGADNNFWGRLRRRKVVQWGIAYAAGAWGLLQGLQFLAEAFGLSSRVLQLGTVVALTGLPIVLVLAWYHGDRGEQRVRGTELAIVTMLFLIGGGLFWRYHSVSEPQLAPPTPAASVSVSAAPAAGPADTRPSIAVLPFDNRSKLEDDVFFVDGIHDDILTKLSKVSGMRVISRTSVEQFRDTRLPIKSIAEQLGVAQILEGGVQRAGNRVRVTVQLVDADTDAHLWAESYDRELTAANIFEIQSEVATAIAMALNSTLTADEKTRLNTIPTQNLEAWETYQIGRQRLAKRTSAGLGEAAKFFRRAIGLDPKFALAYVGLADTLRLETEYSGKPLEATIAESDALVSRALELDENLAEAWASKGGIAMRMGITQKEQAEKFLRRAIELNPNYATAHQWLSATLAIGHREEAMRQIELATELDPLSPIINLNMGNHMMYAGRFDEAEARYRRVMEIDPSMPYSYTNIGNIEAYVRGRFVDAVLLTQKAVAADPDSPVPFRFLTTLYLDIGDDGQAARAIEAARRRWPDATHWHGAMLHLYRGEHKKALQAARTLLALQPRDALGLSILRDADLQAGRPEAARARYASVYPEFVAAEPPKLDTASVTNALDFVIVLQQTGESDRAEALLDQIDDVIRDLPRMGPYGFVIMDVQILALRGQKREALTALAAAEKAGWRGPVWRYYRDCDPNLASIRNEPEFKAVFADIERDMARQRAELAKRPKDVPSALQ